MAPAGTYRSQQQHSLWSYAAPGAIIQLLNQDPDTERVRALCPCIFASQDVSK